MAKPSDSEAGKLKVATLTHDEATRKNIPTAEYQAVMGREEQNPVRVTYERSAAGLDPEKQSRNRDLDPQLIWRGKDEQDWSDLVVQAPPLYIQEKVHPKVLIDDLLRRPAPSGRGAGGEGALNQIDLFSDFNGLPDDAARTEFYQHDAHWSNRMILGDSLQVMASLAEREGLRGKVQCIYLDPPYGIKFNSNFQWSTTSRDVKDGNAAHITREPEQVKAFRDTWRDGIHSYLTYLRDRLTVARDLLTDSGSIFVQIGDENVHRVRAVMDEVFGERNWAATINFQKTAHSSSTLLPAITDAIVWYAKSGERVKYRQLLKRKVRGDAGTVNFDWVESNVDFTVRKLRVDETVPEDDAQCHWRVFRLDNLMSVGSAGNTSVPYIFRGREFFPGPNRHWKTSAAGLDRAARASRLAIFGNSLCQRRYLDDFGVAFYTNVWTDTVWPSFGEPKNYVVQTLTTVVQRCILMATDPGDLVLDPTCGSGTTAYVAEQWGRRWITIDTSRVALALARARIMGARYPYYLLADSPEGRRKEAEITHTVPSSHATRGDIRQGFMYERVPHITLKSIANNAEIDVIWDKWQETLEPLREQLNRLFVGWAEQREAHRPDAPANDGLRSRSAHPTRPFTPFEEWEIPREPEEDWPETAKELHAQWWQARIARQKEIDASIAAKAEHEYLYDKPYEDKKIVRVAGPFTVESLSPHRVLAVDENDELIDHLGDPQGGYGEERNFVQMILENLKTAGVQQAHKEDRIAFTSLMPWPGELICAEGRYLENVSADLSAQVAERAAEVRINSYLHPDELQKATEKRAAIFIGPEFGTVSRPDLVAAAREAGDAGFDVLIACAFNYDAHSAEFDKLGRIPVLKARMNADLHMADDLKNTGKGNLFVIFGEPDIDILDAEDNKIRVKVNGVDVFHPNTGEVRSDGAEGIACWFIDTDYNEESFFVRHAYFLGANDPYKALKTTLKAEINEEAWATLNSDTSRPFDKPKSGRIAVKVINHLGDEVMKVFRVV
jgi:adenine-specific DNA-methyltransferase